MTRVDLNLCAPVVHSQFPFAVWSFLRGKQRWIQILAFSVCSLKKRHLNVPLRFGSDEFVTRANTEKLGHFSKEQNQTKMKSNVCQNSNRKTKSNKFFEMAEWWKSYWINLPFYFPYVAAAVSLWCAVKEKIRWARKTKRCKRNCVLFNMQNNGRCKRTAE